mmetsp:Transcript_89571/g.159021  ORF Transcript_89571/g.159021 Transcript_89571/m.159021 type:complete len:128 (-) Transcript_89571:29-412(-)
MSCRRERPQTIHLETEITSSNTVLIEELDDEAEVFSRVDQTHPKPVYGKFERPSAPVSMSECMSEPKESGPMPRANGVKMSPYCAECGTKFVANAKFCHNCGSFRDGTERPAQHNFCHECGVVLRAT